MKSRKLQDFVSQLLNRVDRPKVIACIGTGKYVGPGVLALYKKFDLVIDILQLLTPWK